MMPIARIFPLRCIAPFPLVLALAACQAGPTVPAALPPAGTPLFGPEGPIGTISGRRGGAAVINPIGGGATGTLVPNGNGTATIFQPNRPPIVIPNPAR